MSLTYISSLIDFVSYSWMAWWLYEKEHGDISANPFLRATFWFALSWIGLRLSRASGYDCPLP